MLFALMRARLEMSVAMAARQHAAAPDNDYLLVSQAGVTRGARRGSRARTRDLAHFRFRDACGYEAQPERARASASCCALAARAPGDGRRPRERAACSTSAPGCRRSTGWRSAATTRSARSTPRPSSRRRTGAGARGTWRSTSSRPRARRCSRRSTAWSSGARTATSRGDYGGLLVLAPRRPFWTLHGHLDPDDRWRPARSRAGDGIARLGAPEVNGGWEPHLHLQLFTDLVGRPRRASRCPTRPTSGAASARTRTCCSGCRAATARAAAAAGHRRARAAR